MCNYVRIKSTPKELENAYQAEYIGDDYTRDDKINGFANPKLPVILDHDTDHIIAAQWGFLPSWAKDSEFAKKTLNARMEEVHQQSLPHFSQCLPRMEMVRRQRKKKRQLPHQNQRPRNLCHWRTVQHLGPSHR